MKDKFKVERRQSFKDIKEKILQDKGPKVIKIIEKDIIDYITCPILSFIPGLMVVIDTILEEIRVGTAFRMIEISNLIPRGASYIFSSLMLRVKEVLRQYMRFDKMFRNSLSKTELAKYLDMPIEGEERTYETTLINELFKTFKRHSTFYIRTKFILLDYLNKFVKKLILEIKEDLKELDFKDDEFRIMEREVCRYILEPIADYYEIDLEDIDGILFEVKLKFIPNDIDIEITPCLLSNYTISLKEINPKYLNVGDIDAFTQKFSSDFLEFRKRLKGIMETFINFHKHLKSELKKLDLASKIKVLVNQGGLSDEE